MGYGDSASACLTEGIKQHLIPPAEIYTTRDDFTQGPIYKADRFDKSRIAYWNGLYNSLEIKEDITSSYYESVKSIKRLKQRTIALFVGDSCHDYLMTGWLISNLPDNNWYITLLEDFRKISSVPVNLALFSPAALSTLFSSLKPLQPEFISYFIDLWKNAVRIASVYRIKNGKEIMHVDEIHYDPFIIDLIPEHFMPLESIIKSIIISSQHTLSDLTILFRIHQLIRAGMLECKGKLVLDSNSLLRKNC